MGLNSSTFLLGVDIGTSSTKACLYSDEGQLVASASQEYSINYPKPTWAEENPDDWLNASISCIQLILRGFRDTRPMYGIRRFILAMRPAELPA